MSTYDYAAVFYNACSLHVDGGFYDNTASYTTPCSASAAVCTLQICVVYPMVPQALIVIDLTVEVQVAA